MDRDPGNRGLECLVSSAHSQDAMHPAVSRRDAADERATRDDASSGTWHDRRKQEPTESADERDGTGDTTWECALLTSFVNLGLQAALHGADVLF